MNKPSREQIIDGLLAEFAYLEQEGITDTGMTWEEYQELLKTKTYEELIEETSTGAGFELDEWLYAWCQ